MEKRTYLLMGVCLAAILLLGTNAHAQESKDADAAFARLSSLVGEWTGVEFGQDVIVTYRLIGNGSTLMEETRLAKGPDTQTMMTMFSVDGDHLIATHYCDAQNQPQMATKTITDPSMKSLVFSFVRVTGMKAPGDYHNTGVEVILEDKDHQTQKWASLTDGKTGTNVFHLKRLEK
ncbi:MAG TPA: hypothetical protein VGR72_05185 [Candidatus Acidoferrales bacterium]|nr:hypothetical protein [Candidatus Acidoferrales bacterium]